MRNVLFREGHPIEKLHRVGLGSLTVEGVPPGRYQMLREKDVETLRRALRGGKGNKRAKREEKRGRRGARGTT
jgi:16S rRNA U516 pseudouridylate synthase RsuA-like enzyme